MFKGKYFCGLDIGSQKIKACLLKAQDADSVAGIMSIRGLIFIATATEARIGRIISVVAVLEVNSVKNVIQRQIAKITSRGDMPASPLNSLPIRVESPLT